MYVPIEDIIKIIDSYRSIYYNNIPSTNYKLIMDALNSLKKEKGIAIQSYWKPSDLQLEALESAYKQLPNIQHFLQSLYNDLKNL